MILEIGTRLENPAHYPDINIVPQGIGKDRYYVRRDGTRY